MFKYIENKIKFYQIIEDLLAYILNCNNFNII